MGFTKKTLHCLGCKAKIASGTVCGHCKPREGEVYLKRVHECIEHERTFNELWTQCQRCQGSLHQDVLCSNSDCPIFYKRKKVQATKARQDGHETGVVMRTQARAEDSSGSGTGTDKKEGVVLGVVGEGEAVVSRMVVVC